MSGGKVLPFRANARTRYLFPQTEEERAKAREAGLLRDALTGSLREMTRVVRFCEKHGRTDEAERAAKIAVEIGKMLREVMT